MKNITGVTGAKTTVSANSPTNTPPLKCITAYTMTQMMIDITINNNFPNTDLGVSDIRPIKPIYIKKYQKIKKTQPLCPFNKNRLFFFPAGNLPIVIVFQLLVASPINIFR